MGYGLVSLVDWCVVCCYGDVVVSEGDVGVVLFVVVGFDDCDVYSWCFWELVCDYEFGGVVVNNDIVEDFGFCCGDCEVVVYLEKDKNFFMGFYCLLEWIWSFFLVVCRFVELR